MPPARSDILTLGRRLHGALRHAINDPETYIGGRVKRQDFEHYACSMYLAGTLAFLEGKHGVRPWQPSPTCIGLNAFLAAGNDKRKTTLLTADVSEAGLDALVCIRNAVVHNDADLAQNTDRQALQKVAAADLPGVQLIGSTVRLLSTDAEDFMEYVRKCFVGVSMLHGDL